MIVPGLILYIAKFIDERKWYCSYNDLIENIYSASGKSWLKLAKIYIYIYIYKCINEYIGMVGWLKTACVLIGYVLNTLAGCVRYS